MSQNRFSIHPVADLSPELHPNEPQLKSKVFKKIVLHCLLKQQQQLRKNKTPTSQTTHVKQCENVC